MGLQVERDIKAIPVDNPYARASAATFSVIHWKGVFGAVFVVEKLQVFANV
jgi:hypothetical protein